MKTFNAILSRLSGKPILAEVIVPQAIVAEIRDGIPTKEETKSIAESLLIEAISKGLKIKNIMINASYHPNQTNKGYVFIHAYDDDNKSFCIHKDQYFNTELLNIALRKELNI